MTKLSIIIPAYKEERRIGQSIEEIDQWIIDSAFEVDVIIIVEQSPDRTLEIAKNKVSACQNAEKFTVIDNQVHRGKGYAVRSGMLLAGGEVLMFMDADLSVPLSEISKAMGILENKPDVDVLIGTRYDGGVVLQKQGAGRRLGSRIYNMMLRLMGLTGVRDTQCGFKLFRRKTRDIFKMCQIDGFGFDIEVLLLAKDLGYNIDQVPVKWHNSINSSFRPLKDGLAVLGDLIRVWRRKS
jgi:dolichyl-phosphate beta-glucosyltransferase